MAECIFLKNLGGKSTDLSFITAESTDILSGKVGASTSGASVSGVINSLAGATYNTSTNQQTMSVSSGKYSTGLQLFRGEKLSAPTASQVLSGATFTIGDTANSTRLLNLAGSMSNLSGSNIDVPINITSSSGYLTMGIPSNGYYTTGGRLQFGAAGLGAAQTSSVASGVTFTSRHGIGLTGSLTTLGATTYAPSTASRSIATGRILTGAQTIQAITGTASAAVARTGKTFSSAKGIGLTGSLANYSASAISPGTAASTLSTAGKIGSANVTLNAISYTNFTDANIKKNVVITIGGKAVTGTFSGYVPDTKDLYKYGSWGTGYSTAIMKYPKARYSSSASSSPTLTFGTTYMDYSHGIYSTTRYSFLAVNKSVSMNDYASVKMLHAQYGGTSGNTVQINSATAYYNIYLPTLAPSYTYMTNQSKTTSYITMYYTNSASSTGTSLRLDSPYVVFLTTSMKYGTEATLTWTLSSVTDSRYLYFHFYSDSWRSLTNYYDRIKRIYYA